MTTHTVNIFVSRSETLGYDALDRVISATFPQGSATMHYDILGPLRSSTITLNGKPYDVATTIRGDEARQSLTYPSADNAPAVMVNEGRDAAGRLTTVLPASGDPV